MVRRQVVGYYDNELEAISAIEDLTDRSRSLLPQHLKDVGGR